MSAYIHKRQKVKIWVDLNSIACKTIYLYKQAEDEETTQHNGCKQERQSYTLLGKAWQESDDDDDGDDGRVTLESSELLRR